MVGRPKNARPKERLNTYIEVETKKRLQLLSESLGRPVGDLMNEAYTLLLNEYQKNGVYAINVKEKEKGRGIMIESDGQKHKADSIVFVNNKGGAAKTTSSTSLAVLLAKEHKKRVLFIDSDYQCNSSTLFGFEKTADEVSLTKYIVDSSESIKKTDEAVPVENYILPTEYKNIDIIRADIDLQGKVEDLLKEISLNYDNLMQILLENIKELNIYDYVIIDSSPALNTFVTNFMLAADWALIPTNVEGFGIESAQEVLNFFRRAAKRKTVATPIGIFFTRVEERTALAKAIPSFAAALEQSGCHVLKTYIPSSANVSDSITTYGKPLTDVYPVSKATKKYRALLDEVVKIIEQKK